MAAEIIYLSLKLIGGNKYRNIPPPFNFYDLVEQVKDELKEEQIVWIKDIIKKRCENKEELIPIDDKLNKFVEYCQ